MKGDYRDSRLHTTHFFSRLCFCTQTVNVLTCCWAVASSPRVDRAVGNEDDSEQQIKRPQLRGLVAHCVSVTVFYIAAESKPRFVVVLRVTRGESSLALKWRVTDV